MLLYLHGFRSSPHSFKARMLAERMQRLDRADEYLCPQLPASPRQAADLALALAKTHVSDKLAIIGSSLGGYYASWVAEQLDCRAVLLNPAVNPARDLQVYSDRAMTGYHDAEPFVFRQEYIKELQRLKIDEYKHPRNYLLIAATGDEVLDWREMMRHYQGARQRVVQGSDHGLSDFASYIDEVLAFCGIAGLD